MLDRLKHLGRSFLAGESGNIAHFAALLMVPIVGAIGLAIESSSWFLMNRAIQNAADAAAVAGSFNGGTSAEDEARAVAKSYGFVNGVNNTQVNFSSTAVCPTTGVANCYRVEIRRDMQLHLMRIVGYDGDVALGAGRGKIIQTFAVARPKGAPDNYCMIGLGTGESIRVNGGPNVDLAGCSMVGNGDLTCNGANSDTGVSYGDAVGASTCGETARSGQSALSDPYDYLNTNSYIPSPTSCTQTGSRPGLSISSATSWAAPVQSCGNATLTGDTTLSNGANNILVIYDGHLDLGGFTLKTDPGTKLTIIFSGWSKTTGPAIDHILRDASGVLDISAPTSGDFKGIAIFQDKRLTGSKNNLDMVYKGNNPTLNVTGLIYMPNGDFDIRGAINHNTGGYKCLGVIAEHVLVSGNGSIFDNATSECVQAGLILPGIPGSEKRQALVG